MNRFKITYFDVAGSRGEELRLALTLAGAAFDDHRLDFPGFARIKADLPFPSVPTLEVDGRVIGQTNAALRFIGRSYGLYPEDIAEAARVDELMDAVEDLRHKITPSMRMQDAGEKAAARQLIASEYIPHWARGVERLLGAGPLAGGAQPNVADIKLFMIDRWLSSGVLSDIPATVLDPHTALKAVVGAFGSLPVVRQRYS